MKESLRIYGVKDSSIKYLSQYQEHLFPHESGSSGRKYIGAVFQIKINKILQFTFEPYYAILPEVLRLLLEGAFTMGKDIKGKEPGVGISQGSDGFSDPYVTKALKDENLVKYKKNQRRIR